MRLPTGLININALLAARRAQHVTVSEQPGRTLLFVASAISRTLLRRFQQALAKMGRRSPAQKRTAPVSVTPGIARTAT